MAYTNDSLFYYVAADDTATPATGFFIPVAELPGIVDTELADTDLAKIGKVIVSILTALETYIADLEGVMPPLGLSLNKSTGFSATDVLNTYRIGMTFYSNLLTDKVDVLPVPISGTHSGEGALPLDELFPSITKVVSTVDTVDKGIIIKQTFIDAYSGTGAYAATDVTLDSRNTLFGMLVGFCHNAAVPVRTNSVASCFKTKTLGNLAATTLSSVYYDTITDPMSALQAANKVFQLPLLITGVLGVEMDIPTSLEVKFSTN